MVNDRRREAGMRNLIKFDTTVNVTTLIAVIGVLASIFIWSGGIEKAQAVQEDKINSLHRELDQMHDSYDKINEKLDKILLNEIGHNK